MAATTNVMMQYAAALINGRPKAPQPKKLTVEEILANWPCIEEEEAAPVERTPDYYTGTRSSFGVSYDWDFDHVEWIPEDDPEYKEYNFDEAMEALIELDTPSPWQLRHFYRLLHTEKDEKIDELIDMCKKSIDFVPIKRERNLLLLQKLRVLLHLYRMTRDKVRTRLQLCHIDDWWYVKNIQQGKVYAWRNYKYAHDRGGVYDREKYYNAVSESGEEEATGELSEISKDQASNVVLTTDRVPSETISTIPSVRWSQFVSNDVVDDYKTITDRWYTLGSFNWTTDQRTSQIIFKIKDRKPILPLDIIHNSGVELCDMPNLIPFKVHTYWRGDIEVRIQVNSNKFQIGQLIAAFYYQPANNYNISDKLNVYGLSQMDHVIIQASASNDGVLRIPYRNVFPFLATRKVPGQSSKQIVLNLGELYIMVMNPLTTTVQGPKTCKVSVLTRFVNSEFTGTCYGGFVAQPEAGLEQIAKPLLGGAMRLLDTTFGDPNRDNPPLNRQPGTLVPTASHNWSAGTGIVEPLHFLRLDPRGQTHHPPGCDADNLMTVDAITTRYGLIKQVEWKTETHTGGKRGDELWREWAHPGIKLEMDKGNSGPSAPYILTPVGIISNMFMQWRGSLEFKFQIVASQFHTGRLMVGYIPGWHEQVGIRELKASPHAIFDLQENREFVYEVPFVSYRPWWPRQNSGNFQAANSDPPSSIYLLIYNELVVMESIPDTVYINVYMRAGGSFEVSIPVQPSISLTWHKEFVYPDSDVTGAVEGYYPYYYGYWQGINNSNTLVARWGTLVDQIAQFRMLDKQLGRDQYMYYLPSGKEGYPTIGSKAGLTTTPEAAIIYQSGHGFAILIPCQSVDAAQKAAELIYINKVSLSDPLLNEYFFADSTIFIAGDYGVGNPKWVGIIGVRASRRRLPRSASESDYEIIHANPEGEEVISRNILTTTTTLAASNHGFYFYGENHGDLKDLCRRYQMYGQVQFTSLMDKQINKCALLFHALPQGLVPAVGLPSVPNELFNRCREGHIPLIASLFRYYRGGLRFRIVFPADMSAKVWVQHRPDRKFRGEEDRHIRLCHQVDTAQGVFNHGYAYYIQVTNINPIVEFEVPFYNNTCYNLLQQPVVFDEAHAWSVSLGQIMVGIEWLGDPSVHNGKWVSIYTSLADDHQFSHWIGGAQYQLLDNNQTANSENGPEEDVEVTVFERATLMTPVERYVASAYSEGKFSFSPITSIREGLKDDIKEMVSTSAATLRDEISGVMDRIYSEMGSAIGAADKSSIAAILGNLVHVAVNPTISTIATSVVNIVISLGILGVTMLTSAVAIVKQIFITLRGDAQAKQHRDPPCVGSAVSEAGGEDTTELDKSIAGWCALLYNGVISFFNVTIKKPKSWLQWKGVLTKDLSDSTRGANQIFIFIKNTMDCIRRMLDYILGRSSKDYTMLKLLETDPQVLKDWCKEVLYLTDPTVRRERKGDISYCNRVFDAQAFGQIVLTDISSEIKTDKNSAIIAKLFDKITSLADDLLEQGEHPHVRKLPFTVYQWGEPGTGKSTVSTAVCAHLLSEAKVRTKKGLKCTLNPQSDYWDQCDHQPVLEIDDLWAVSTPGALEKQLLTVFQVCSPIVLSPPKAALAEKKMRYNPEIFWINSNKDFPIYNDVNREAIWRRRDILVKVEKSNTKVKDCPHCHNGVSITQVDPSYLLDFHHLQFSIADDVCNSETTYAGPYKYSEYLRILTARFLAFRAREQIMFSQRVKDQELLATLEKSEDLDEYSGILEKYAVLQDRRYIEYSTLKERTLMSDLKSLLDGIDWRAKESYSFIQNKLYDVTIAIPKNKVQRLFSYAVHEGPMDPSTSTYRQELEIIADEEHEAMLYAMNTTPNTVMLAELVHEEILTKDEYEKYLLIMQRLHDDGDVLNQFLEYHADMIARVRRVDESRVRNLETYLDTAIRHAPRMVNKPFCSHFMPGVDDTTISQNKILAVLDDLDVDISSPCLNRCILKSPLLRVKWYERWLKVNPTYRLMYNQNRVERFPAYLRTHEIRSEIKPDNLIQHLYLWLKNRWENSLSPIIKKIIWWVKDAWPKIERILVFTGLVACVAAPVVGTYSIIKQAGVEQDRQYELDKLATLAYAKEQGLPIDESIWFGEHGKLGVLPESLTNESFKAQPQATVYAAGAPVAKHIPSVAKPIVVTSQASQQCEAIKTILDNNVVWMRMYYETGRMDNFRCIMIRGRQMLAQRHYFEIANSKKIVRQSFIFDKDNKNRANGCEIFVDFLDCPKAYYKGDIEGVAYESNYVTIELPAYIPEFKSIVKFICPWNEWASIGREGILCSGKGKNKEIPITWTDRVPMFINSSGPSSQIVLTKCFRYPIHGAGLCGSVLLAQNKETPIVGLHVAGVEGVNGFGLAEPLYREMFAKMPIPEHRPQKELAEPKLIDLDQKNVDLGSMLYSIGCVDPKDAQSQSGKSQIKPSMIHGVFEVRTEPNPLHKHDPRLPLSDRSPYELGCRKHGLPNKPIPNKIIEKAYAHLNNKILAKVKPLRTSCGVVSEQIAVCGLPDVPEYNALNFSTSSGFPLSSRKPKGEKGKRWLFDMSESEKGYVLHSLHPELRRLIDVTQEMRKRCIRPMTVFSDCLKDTTLPKEKCRVLGKTRIFSISPTQYTIPFRQYMLDFMAGYRRARLDVNHGIGIDVNSMEWTDLAIRLQQKGEQIITGDYSNYGPALNLELAEAAVCIIINWYKHWCPDESTDTRTIRAILLQELLCAYHLCGNYIYRVPCGIPSGSPITDILNSLVNNLYIYCAWIGITGKTLSEYEKHCWEVVYGDDLAINVSDEMICEFNTITMSRFFEEYLIKFTDADKTGVMIPAHTLATATFLKHSFIKHPMRPLTFMAALDSVSVEGCANWIKPNKQNTDQELTQQNCIMTCVLAYGHGPYYFNRIRAKLLKAMQSKGIFQPLPDWDELDSKNFESFSTKIPFDINEYYIVT